MTPSTPVTQGLEPVAIWKQFESLAAIPRPSYEEQRVQQFVKDFADERGFEWQEDAAGNVVVRRPGTGGGEGAPGVVVQGHVDMVCEKTSGVEHDFSNDPIKLCVDGDWLKAQGTTLGADNGLGVAAALALLDMPKDAKLPPIEGLFTTAEEVGLIGASALDGSMVKGRILLNLDAEDWPNVYVGCAGGGSSTIKLSCAKEPASSGTKSMRLSVSGLLSGHSGIAIHLYRGNALKICARVLAALAGPGGLGCSIARFAGGDKHNVIPKECEALLVVPAGKVDAAKQAVAAVEREVMAEYGECEKGLKISLEDCEAPGTVICDGDAQKLISLINLLPHGPVKYSHSIPDMVETSTNLASLKVTEGSGSDEYTAFCSTRSSIAFALEEVRRQISTLASLCGASYEKNDAYPGWQPNMESQVLKYTVEEVTDIIGEKPTITAIHAGLECGILGAKLPECDMVAFGPTILGAHTPEERVQISTVKPFWDLVLRVINRAASV